VVHGSALDPHSWVLLPLHLLYLPSEKCVHLFYVLSKLLKCLGVSPSGYLLFQLQTLLVVRFFQERLGDRVLHVFHLHILLFHLFLTGADAFKEKFVFIYEVLENGIEELVLHKLLLGAQVLSHIKSL